jgi:hypothetical protein
VTAPGFQIRCGECGADLTDRPRGDSHQDCPERDRVKRETAALQRIHEKMEAGR